MLLLPTTVVDITMCSIEIRFAQNTTQNLIGGELETMPVFINVSAGRFVVRRSVGNFVLVCISLYNANRLNEL